ncbi:MAG TPA: hypothetical protein VKT72_02350 [Candidatus Baltobacteraceae bacterium]|nr:hypothetical protein [Candidatus Baltobacteraceae bacterium]
MRKTFFWLLAVIAVLVVSFAAHPASADPADDLAAVKKAFQNVSSVHIDVTRTRMSGSLDMVNPDKMHWTMSDGIQMIAIGQQAWMSMGGKWMQRPPMPTATTMMQHFRTLNLEGSDIRKEYKVTDKGMTSAGGVPARQYHIVNKQNGNTFDLFVGANNLPVRYADADGSVWTFSQYNSVADIKPPM